MKYSLIFFHLFLSAVIANPVLKNSQLWHNRIYGGEFTDQNQYPFATVSFILPSFEVTGGALISSEYVLTTAQYIYKDVSTIFIYIGAHKYNDQDEIGRENIYIDGDDLPNRMIIHEEFDPVTLAKNIALIRLTKKLEFNDVIQKISLPPSSLTPKSLEGSTATLMGWGTSEENDETEDYPRHVNVTLMPQAICNHYYPSLNRSLMLCSDGEMKQGACDGDVGTSLITTLEDGSIALIGIVSFINSLGCDSQWPTMYISIIGYLDWIQENMVES